MQHFKLYGFTSVWHCDNCVILHQFPIVCSCIYPYRQAIWHSLTAFYDAYDDERTNRSFRSIPFPSCEISGDRSALCSSSLSFLCFHISLNSRVHDIIRSNQICMKVSDVIPLTPTVYQMYISRVYSVGVHSGSVEALFRAYIHRSWNGKLMFLTTDTRVRVCVYDISKSNISKDAYTSEWKGICCTVSVDGWCHRHRHRHKTTQ